MRDEGRMKDDQDWQMLDRKLFVSVPRFIAELEQLGYENLKSPDINSVDVKSDEITKLAEEVRLISSEITNREIQEEMKSSDITTDESKPKNYSSPQEMKSSEIKNENLKSDEIIDSKNEVIEILKETIESKEKDISHLRNVVETLSGQNQILTRQNAWLTNLLVAPKNQRESMKSDDISHETPQEDAKGKKEPIEADYRPMGENPESEEIEKPVEVEQKPTPEPEPTHST